MKPVYKIVLADKAQEIKALLEAVGVEVKVLPFSSKGCYQPHYRQLQIKNGLPFGRSKPYIDLMHELSIKDFYEVF
jgi:hypothetical protein